MSSLLRPTGLQSDYKRVDKPGSEVIDPAAGYDEEIDKLGSHVKTDQSYEEIDWINELKFKFQVEDLFFDGITDAYPLINRSHLRERDSQLEDIKTTWQNRAEGYRSAPVTQDRNYYKVPVCIGLPGVGKSALAEKSSELLNEVSPDTVSIAITIPYFNGHSLQACEISTTEGIANTKGIVWRLLHRWFLERRSASNYASFSSYMEMMATKDSGSNWDFTKALRVIRRVLLRACCLEENAILSICVAIDEYQTIPGSLTDIMRMLLEASITLAAHHRIHLYPIMAGTQWTKLDGTGSSTDFCVKIPLPYLSSAATLDIARDFLPGKLSSDILRDSIALLGQLPRPLLFYLENVRKRFNADATIWKTELANKRRFTFDTYLKAWSLQHPETLLMIVAYAVTGTPVRDDGESPISYKHYLSDRDPMKFEMLRRLTWNQLAGAGLLQLQPLPALSSNLLVSKVDVPVAALLTLVASTEKDFDVSKPYQWLFVCSLRGIIDLNVKDVHLEPWQQWEVFGAHFHALRINAFMVIGHTSIPLKDLFSGLLCHWPSVGNDVYVKLKPALIYECDKRLSPDLNLKKLAERGGNIAFGVDNIISQRSNVYRVCVNGTGGEAVDIFFVLFCFRHQIGVKDSQKLVPFLFLDQRKREARNLSQAYLKELVAGMKQQVPTCFPEIGQVVPLIFSALAKTGSRLSWTDWRDGNVSIYCRACLSDYLGSCRHLPSVNLLICPRTANQTTLMSFLGCSNEIAKSCVEFISNCKLGLLTADSFIRFFEAQYSTALDSNRLEEIQHVVTEHFIFDEKEEDDEGLPGLSSLFDDIL